MSTGEQTDMPQLSAPILRPTRKPKREATFDLVVGDWEFKTQHQHKPNCKYDGCFGTGRTGFWPDATKLDPSLRQPMPCPTVGYWEVTKQPDIAPFLTNK